MPPSDPKRRRKGGSSKAWISSAVERQIDENLKKLYQTQLEADLPPSLKALVEQLRKGGPDDGPNDGSGNEEHDGSRK